MRSSCPATWTALWLRESRLVRRSPSALRAPPDMTSVTLHFDGEKDRKHTIKMVVPPSWADKPCAKVAKYYAKSFNAAHADKPVDLAKLRLSCDSDRSFLDLASPVAAALRDGEAYSFSERRPSEAETKVLYTRGLTEKPEPPKPHVVEHHERGSRHREAP